MKRAMVCALLSYGVAVSAMGEELQGVDTWAGIKPLPAVMTVREVCLYRSERGPEGMVYTVIGSV